MLKCSLSKNKSYPVNEIFFNSTEHSYQLKLADKTENCPSGIFTSKKLELKIVADNKIPSLQFNAQDNRPELTLNSESLIKHQTVQNHNAMPQETGSHVSPGVVLLGIGLVIVVIWLILKPKNNQETPYTGGFNSNNNLNNPNDPNNPYNNPYSNQSNNLNNQNNPYNNQPQQQGPSKTGSFLTGLAGGAVGAVVGNALYDKLKGSEAQAQPMQQPSDDSNFVDDDNDQFDNDDSDTFSSDD